MNWAYHPDFGGMTAYEITSLPEGADGQVRETLRKIAGTILEDASDPLILEDAQNALQMGNGCPIQGVWNWIKPRIRFQQDEDSARKLQVSDPRIPDVIEVLIRPADQAWLIRMNRGFEDCDGFVHYGACLLVALGVPVRMVTVSADTDAPSRFSHVYLASYLNGQRVPLDLSHGEYPGWECPNTGRVKEWDLDCAFLPSGEAMVLMAVAALIAALVISKKRRAS
jgi:hypothetical protein